VDGFKIDTGSGPFFLLGEVPLALRQYVVLEQHGLTLIKMPTKEEIEAAERELQLEELRRVENQILRGGEEWTELRMIDGSLMPLSAGEAATYDQLVAFREYLNAGFGVGLKARATLGSP